MGDSEFAYRTLLFSVVCILGMSLFINCFVPSAASDEDALELLDDYYAFTGANKNATKESVWVLEGIYTPYTGGSTYGTTDDGWIYGERIQTYSPQQYVGTARAFTVERGDGAYYYQEDSQDYDKDAGTGHAKGDIYSYVVFDSEHQSDIFFAKSQKYNLDGTAYTSDSGTFYYTYTGYRYSFIPTTGSLTYEDEDGNTHTETITPTTTSLSLIWYVYYTTSGLQGQLILSGSDSGQQYITGDQIVRQYDSTINTARFEMTFNGGVKMGIYIQMDSTYLNRGYSIQECYNNGWWAVMVTSLSTDADAYTSTSNSLNAWSLFSTAIDLMTFDYSQYAMSSLMGVLCSLVIVIPLYLGLIAYASGSWPSLAMVGLLAQVEGLVQAVRNFGFLGSLFGVIPPDITQALLGMIGMG